MEQNLIAITTLCSHYEIEVSFFDALHQMGLIHIEIIEQDRYLHQDQIGEFEKIVRLHNELNVNLEGIDVVLHLLEKEKRLQHELIALKNRLRLYENE